MLKTKFEKSVAISEIMTLVVATFAFAFLLGNVGFVSAQEVVRDNTGFVDHGTFYVDSFGSEYSKSKWTLSPEGTQLTRKVTSVKASESNPEALDNLLVNEGKELALRSATTVPANTIKSRWDGFVAKRTNEAVDSTIGAGESSSKTPAKKPSLIDKITGFYGYEGGTGEDFDFTDSLMSSLAWGGTAAAITYGVASVADVGDATRDAATAAIGAGVAVARAATTFLGDPLIGIGIGAAVGIAIFLLMNKEEKHEVVQFQCLPWQAPTGGDRCEVCNEQPGGLPCSEYQCKALGQGCELVNKGTSEERCVWVNRNDVTPPVIQPFEAVLTDGLDYRPSDLALPNPEDRGWRIVDLSKQDGCLDAFTPMKFGIAADEPARCKLDYTRKSEFSDMQFFFSASNLLRYNHSQQMSLPGPSAINNASPLIQNDGEYTLFARCEDANGNHNEGNLVFEFCVDAGPDTTAPRIVNTNIENNRPVAYNTTSLALEVYVNEPSECRWDFLDRNFEDMENDMACATNVFQMNAQDTYTCRTTLTGIRDNRENDYFIRCKDKPSFPDNERNPNMESLAFTVIGTQPLLINSVSPNNTIIRDATNTIRVPIEVETGAGYMEGLSSCYYSNTGEDDDYILFFETNKENAKHKQELFLPEGNYHYWIKCIDLGGNTDTEEIDFTVISDNDPPATARIYYEEGRLKLITQEAATCVYSTDSCNYLFSDGISLQTTGEESVNHYTEWNTNTNYYIKCQDEFGNEPLPNSCSVIARPFSEIQTVQG